MEQHGCAELALRVAGVVEVRVDERHVAGVVPRGCGETEEGEGRKTGRAGTREERAGFEGRVGEPKGVCLEKGECSAARRISGVFREEGWGDDVKGGERDWIARSPPVEDRAELACCEAIIPANADLQLDEPF